MNIREKLRENLQIARVNVIELEKELANYDLMVELNMQDGIGAGDVFRGPLNNPCWLAKVSFHGNQYQLMGLGAVTNSDEFFWNTHTLEEIKRFLILNKMRRVRNISGEIYRLASDN